jgi:hypothetical protein
VHGSGPDRPGHLAVGDDRRFDWDRAVAGRSGDESSVPARGLIVSRRGPAGRGRKEGNSNMDMGMRTGMYDGSGKEFETRTTVTAIGNGPPGRKSESGSSRSLRLSR